MSPWIKGIVGVGVFLGALTCVHWARIWKGSTAEKTDTLFHEPQTDENSNPSLSQETVGARFERLTQKYKHQLTKEDLAELEDITTYHMTEISYLNLRDNKLLNQEMITHVFQEATGLKEIYAGKHQNLGDIQFGCWGRGIQLIRADRN